jgi:hypothetical protein
MGDGIYRLNSVTEVYDLKLKFKDTSLGATYSAWVSSDGELWRVIDENADIISDTTGKYMLVNPYVNAAFLKFETNGCDLEDIKVYGRRIGEMELHIINCTESEANKGVEVGSNTYDRDTSTLWAAEGDDEWIIYEFDKPLELSGIEIMWNSGTAISYNIYTRARVSYRISCSAGPLFHLS